MTKKISVIMLTYNREQLVGRAIESILGQTMTEFEYIIVDNGSSDRSGEIADEYANPLMGLDMSCEIIKTYENKPVASTITIYNLSTKTYNDIYEKADAFRLSCARGKDEDYIPFYTGYPIRSTQVAKKTILTSNKGFMAQDANAGRAGQNDLETNITNLYTLIKKGT